MRGFGIGLFLVAVSLVAGATLLLLDGSPGSAQTPADLAIDMDVSGNNARLTNGVNLQDCQEIDSGGTNTTQLDVLIPTPGIDSADGLAGFQFDLLYNPSIVNVTAEDQNFLLAAAVGSTLISFSDFLPDSDGTFTSAALDFGNPPGIEPAGVHEVGRGVLVRLTLTGVAPGTSTLALTNVIFLDADANEIPVGTITNATVVVDGNCPTTLTVIKIVDNTGGGTATVSSFVLRIDTVPVTSGVANNVTPGVHTVSEDNPGIAYSTVIGGDCAPTGLITLASGDNKTCTVTNTFVPPKLTVTKIVNNTGGGTATVSSFTLRVDGNAVTSGVQNTFLPGTHTVSEDPPGPAYSTVISGDCNAAGSVTLAGGQVKSCTVTNTFVPPTIKIQKVVDNSAGGSLTPDDFTLRLDGNVVIRNVATVVTPGTHIVGEDDPGPNYITTIAGDCAPNGTVSVSGGQNKTCTITNTFSATSNISIGSGSAGPGGSVTVPLQVQNVPAGLGIGAATIDVTYDPSVLTPTVCIDDPLSVFSADVCNMNFAPGVIRFVGISTGGVFVDTIFANITFSGAGTSDLTLGVVTYTDPGGSPLPYATQDGSITIGPQDGDVDCDLDIDAIDALFSLQYVSGTRTGTTNCPPGPGELYLPANDVDGDGDADAVDTLFIFQCVVGIPNLLCSGPQADLEISSQSVLSPPATIPVGQNTILTVEKTIHNNGPLSPVDVTIGATLLAPPDCTVTPNPLNPTTVTGLQASMATVVQESYTVNCSLPSNHIFTFNNSIAPSTAAYTDPNGSNNSASTPVSIPVVATSDIEVTSQSAIAPPASAPAGANFILSFDATFHNNGPFTPVSPTVLAVLSGPPDCTITPAGGNPTSVPGLVTSVAASVQLDFTVNCSLLTGHTFTLNTTLSHSDVHITDPTPANDTASTQVIVSITASADLKISAQNAVTPPATAPVNTNFTLTFEKIVHNNGPLTPANADLAPVLSAPPDCTVTPDPLNPASVTGLVASTAAFIQEKYTVNCSLPSDHTFTLDNTISPSTPGVIDPNSGNNTASTPVDVSLLADADLELSSVTVGSPASSPVATPFSVTADVTLDNNGAFGPVNADASITLNLPADCSTLDTNPVDVQDTSLAVATPTALPQAAWSVTCTDPSAHNFSVDATVTPDQLHVADATPANDSASGASNTNVTADADLEVSSVTVGSPASSPVATPFSVTADVTLDNNGAFGPVNADASITLNLPPDCSTLDTNPVSVQDTSLAVATPTALPQAAWSVTCTDPSTHNFSVDATVTPDQLHVADATPANDTASGNSNTDVTASSDIEITTQAAVTPPASAPINTDFTLTFDKTVHNNGPFTPVDADLAPVLSAPPDCTVTPDVLNPSSVSGLATSVATVVQESFTVNCSLPSNHTFTLDNTISHANVHISDATPANDTASTQVIVSLLADADLEVSSVTVGSPASSPVATPFSVTADVTLDNNGAFGPVNADASITLNLPPDCSTPDTNPVDVQDTSLAVATPTALPQAAWSVTCTDPSTHNFSVDATVTPDQLHVADATPANDTASGNSNTDVTASSDIEITTQAAVTPPASAPASTDFTLTFDKTIHNNGPFGPVDIDIAAVLSAPADCTVTPDVLNPTSASGVATSVATVVQESFTVNCTSTGSHDFTLDNTISHANIHISDANAANDTASTLVTVVIS
jgi:hypothetical protein